MVARNTLSLGVPSLNLHLSKVKQAPNSHLLLLLQCGTGASPVLEHLLPPFILIALRHLATARLVSLEEIGMGILIKIPFSSDGDTGRRIRATLLGAL